MSPIRITALKLYGAPMSGCTARVRIASRLKAINVPLTVQTIDMHGGENQGAAYKAVNPNGSVPALVLEYEENSVGEGEKESSKKTVTMTQSIAMLDMLESYFPTPALLPAAERLADRARVLEMAALVACEIQAPQNTRIRKKIKSDFGGDGAVWARDIYERGLGVYEELIRRGRKEGGGGRYSVGDEVTWADVFLVPQVQGGLRVGLELGNYPLLEGVVNECWKLEAFQKGGVGEHGKLVP